MQRTFVAAWKLVFAATPIPIQMQSSELEMKEFVWMIFVGNNSYNMGPHDTGRRAVLDSGKIEMVVVPARSRWTLARLILNAVQGQVRPRYVQHIQSERADIQVPVEVGASEVALDGEVLRFEGSLVIRSMPKSLWVVAP
jgi:diacylglycerol kinase family enzyme